MMGYPQIKGELEEDFKKLDFEHCIILRPGLLMGARWVCSLSGLEGPGAATDKTTGTSSEGPNGSRKSSLEV